MAIGSSTRPSKRNFDCVQSGNTERNSLCLNSVGPYETYGNQDSKFDGRPQAPVRMSPNFNHLELEEVLITFDTKFVFILWTNECGS